MAQSITEGLKPGGRPAESSGLPGLNVNSLFSAARCWWKVATPIGLLLAVGAGVATSRLVEPRYTAATWIEIRERPEILVSSGGPEDPRKFVQNQLELIKSPLVLDSVAAIPAVANTPELMADGDPVTALRRLLKIRAQGQSDFFVIEFTSVSREKAAQVVNAVAQSYLKMHRGNLSHRHEQTVGLLETLQQTQQSVVQLHRDNMQEMSKALTGKDPFAAQTGKTITLQDPLQEVHSLLITQQLSQRVLSMEVQAERQRMEKQSFAPSSGEVDRLIAANPQVAQLERVLSEVRLKIKAHEANSVNLKKNTLHAALVREEAEKSALLDKIVAEMKAEVKEGVEKSARAAREHEIAQMEEQLANTDSTIQFLQDQISAAGQNRKELKGETLDLELTRSEYERSAAVFDKIADRLLVIKMEREAPERVAIAKEAAVPTIPDEALPYKKIGMFGLGAFAIPFALAVGFEVLYRRVGNRDQLESLGKLRVVGEVPALPRLARARKRVPGERNRALQLFEESVDGLRTYLTLVESLRGMQVLAVTSAVSREGKTSLAAQLAVSVASATGEPTLLIDGDMRSPDIHEIFGVDCSPGLAEVLLGEVSVEDAIETDFSAALHLLPAGQLATSPHRLLGNGEFAGVLDKLRGMYRYIVIDTPPILPASEALVMAQAADATVLCARRDYSRIGQVAEAHRRLQAAGAKMAGAVLNGIPFRNYAQRYGSYYYSRKRLPRVPAGDETATA
ncbi:MAG: polysaccharide biosynthesis tyrosine autokinase [Pirellulaceae bacterium]